MKNNKIRLADSLFKYLAALGVKNVFRVTGRGSLFLSDALAVNNDIDSVSLTMNSHVGLPLWLPARPTTVLVCVSCLLAVLLPML